MYFKICLKILVLKVHAMIRSQFPISGSVGPPAFFSPFCSWYWPIYWYLYHVMDVGKFFRCSSVSFDIKLRESTSQKIKYGNTFHSAKSVQIRSYFWLVFSRIQSEYEKIRTRHYSVFGHFSRSVLKRRNIPHRYETFRFCLLRPIIKICEERCAMQLY